MKRGIVALIAVIALMSAAGVGFATFTSSVYVNATGNAGSVDLIFAAPAVSIPYVDSFSSSVDTCSAALASPVAGPSPYTYSSSTITFSTGGFAPGDYCLFNNFAGPYAQIANTGNLPATITETATCSINGGAPTAIAAPTGPVEYGGITWVCGYFLFGDTVLDGGYGPIAGNSALGYAAVVVLPSSAGNSAEGQSVTFAITITGSI